MPPFLIGGRATTETSVRLVLNGFLETKMQVCHLQQVKSKAVQDKFKMSLKL